MLMETGKVMKILVVDDEAMILHPIARSLELAGFQVSRAGSAFEAKELLEQQPVDLLLCDINMPKLKGTDLVADLRKAGGLAGTKVVFMSGLLTQENLAGLSLLDKVSFIAKPFLMHDLVQLVHRSLSEPLPGEGASPSSKEGSFEITGPLPAVE